MVSFYPHIQDRFSRQRFTGLPLTLLITALVLSLGLLLTIVRLYLARDPLLTLDANLAHLLYSIRGSGTLAFFYYVTSFGEWSVAIGTSVCLSVFLWIKKERLLVLAQWMSILMGESVTQFGKIVLHRDRPDLAVRAIDVSSFSFPSGHATTATVFFGFLVYLMFRAYRSWLVRVPVLLVAGLCMILVDASRMYLGVHYLSDVIVGNLVGISALLISIVSIELIAQRTKFPALRAFHFPQMIAVLIFASVGAFVFRTIVPVSVTNKITVPVQSIQTEDIANLFIQGTLSTSTASLLGTPRDPVNIILVASSTCFVEKIQAAQWIEIAWATPSLTLKTLPDFYQGLPNDFVFEKQVVSSSSSIVERVRIWNTNYATPEGSVYIGTVAYSHDSFASDLLRAGSVSTTRQMNIAPSSTKATIPAIILSGCGI